MSAPLMGKVVVRLNASTREPLGVGECVGYLGEPSYLIVENGSLSAFHWAESITRAATPDEELRFMRAKAERLAQLVRELGGEL